MSFVLAVCAEMVHRDLPVVERARLLHESGFAVEIWDWTTKDLPALAATGATFTSMTGYVDGSLTDHDGADSLLASAARSVEASRTLGSPHLNLHGTGLDPQGLPVHPVETVTGAMWVAAVDSPHLRMNLDLYHAQIGEGNLIDLVRATLPLVGEIQVADVPGRCEPGTGEIRYPAVAAALADAGYEGVVAMEAWASGDPASALEAFRAAFTV